MGTIPMPLPLSIKEVENYRKGSRQKALDKAAGSINWVIDAMVFRGYKKDDVSFEICIPRFNSMFATGDIEFTTFDYTRDKKTFTYKGFRFFQNKKLQPGDFELKWKVK